MKNRLSTFLLLTLALCNHQIIAQGLQVETQSNTSCGLPNGAASASVDGVTDGYTFQWYEGTSLIFTGPGATNLSPGVYTVSAVDNTTGDLVGILQAQISDERHIPVITILTTPNTSCTSPNGALTAVVENAPINYLFEWHDGTDTGSPVISSGQTVTGKPGGIYTVKVTDISSACVSIASATISDAMAVPDVSIQVLPVTSCMLPDGQLHASVTGAASDYTFAWYDQGNTLLSSNQTVDQVQAGNYSVVVTDINSLCPTTLSATVLDLRVFPVVTIQVSANTNCSEPNGSLTATPEGLAADYMFAWYKEPVVLTDPPLSTSPAIGNLDEGLYTVRVTNIVTGCVSSTTAQITNDCQSFGPQVASKAKEISAVLKKGQASTIEYFPNPAKESLWVRSDRRVSVTLINSNGKVIFSGDLSPSATPTAIDLSDKRAGKYVLQIIEGGRSSFYHIVVRD
jgi:hypothetical protein